MRAAARIRDARWLKLSAAALALYSLGGGVISFGGWAFDLPRLTDWDNDGISIQPNASLCVIFSGLALLSLLLAYRRAALLFGSVVALLGGLTLLEWISGVSLGLDTLFLFDRTWGTRGVVFPGRMGPPGSLCWTLLGAALVLAAAPLRARPLAPVLGLTALTISALSLIGYLYRVDQLFALPYLTVIALQTTTFIAAVSLGLILVHPQAEPMRTLLDPGAAGLLARRLVPPLLVGPVVLGYLRVQGQDAGLFDTGFGTAILVLTLIALLLALLWPPLRAVRSHEQRDRENAMARARAEDALRASQRAELERRQEIETLVGAAPAAIWVAHDRECRVITGNPAAAAMMRLDPDSNMSLTAVAPEKPQGITVYIDGQAVADADLPLQTAARTGRAVLNQELEFRFGDGTSSWAYGNAVPLFDAQNEIRGAVGAFVEVTALKQAQESLREADRRKDEFLATLAHELRNPLAPVRNAVEILRLKDLHEPEVRWARDVIDRQVSHMVRLVDDLLDLNRINIGKIELAREPVEVGEFVRAGVEASQPLVDERKHELAVELPPQHAYVNGDSTRLAQAVCNLLNNSAKYTEPGGRIVCRVESQGGFAVITVSDNGIGIPPERQSEIFAMFVQVDRSRTNARGGLGIGLTLVKHVVEMHGGDVVAHSEGPGTGSTFVVRLPLCDPALTQRPAGTAPTPAAPAVRRVLVVDDNRDAADSLEVMLRIAGNDVRIAYNGVEAVRVAEEFQPSVVLLDLGMPRMNGYDAARAIRRTCPAAGTALIAVTGWGLEEDRRRSKDAGFDHHLVKPVSAERLNALLASLPLPLPAPDDHPPPG